MRNLDIMIDLETVALGTKPAIIQIGACVFDANSPEFMATDTFSVNINLFDSLMHGAEINIETIEWWRLQSKEARASVSAEGCSLSAALTHFASYVISREARAIWSHGAATDIPWLASSYALAKLPLPWTHRQPRDTRTLFDIAESRGWTYPDSPDGSVDHSALSDAVSQAHAVWSAMRVVNNA